VKLTRRKRKILKEKQLRLRTAEDIRVKELREEYNKSIYGFTHPTEWQRLAKDLK